MGGNAIKTVPIRRFNREEYEALCEKVRHIFATDPRVRGTRYEIIGNFESKDTFGDLDILIQENGESYQRPRPGGFYSAIFESKEIHENGPVISLEHEGFQIDFIETPRDEFDFASVYYRFNDLGNLIGKTARNLGLKYGFKGLVYTLRDGIGDKVGEVVVTKNPAEALKFLDYDWERFQKGFNNLEEIFQYVVSSKYFNASVYALDKLNHVDRIRDKKRKTYQEFLEWMKIRVLPDDPVPDASLFFPQIRRAFPEFAMQYDLIRAKLAKKARVKEKFNGDWISAITGLKEKKLGDFMQQFREKFKTEDDLHDYVLYTSLGELSDAVLALQNRLEM